MSIEEAKDKGYLGDGVYIAHDGYHLWITAENGIETKAAIALDPSVLQQLIDYARRHGYART